MLRKVIFKLNVYELITGNKTFIDTKQTYQPMILGHNYKHISFLGLTVQLLMYN